MSMFVRRVAGVVAVALAPMTYMTAVSPAISSAEPQDCGPGNWWDPGANMCRPLLPPPPQDCGPGNWWDPGANMCRPVLPPPPQDCGPGNWWDPGANMCRPVVPPPPP
jgi:hypothetical protein